MTKERLEPATEADAASCGCGCTTLSRRSVLGGLAVAGVAAGMGPAFAATAAAPATPEELPPQVGDFLVSANGNTPLTPEDVRLNSSPYESFAMAPDGTVRNAAYENTVLLLRYDPTTLTEDVAAKAGEGVLGYTIICTHAGCPLAPTLKGKLLGCDCHGSRFDPLKNGKVSHGPAVRKLPQLGLGLQDGKLVVASAFDSRIGGDMMGEDDR